MCREDTIIYGQRKQNIRGCLPELPVDAWCDFRRDYEAGMTLKQIADKYVCDPRTIRKCIISNRGSTELGRRTAPTKLTAFAVQVDALYEELITAVLCTGAGKPGICDLSRTVTEKLQQAGYTGSERTVRNYLRNNYQFVSGKYENRERTNYAENKNDTEPVRSNSHGRL